MRRDGRATKAAALRLKTCIDNLLVSWRALNPQLRWVIDDRIFEAGMHGHTDAAIKWELQDGTPFFWQRFYALDDNEQLKQIRAAVARLDKKGGR